jgi:predicted CXXCH cytochrome family protein
MSPLFLHLSRGRRPALARLLEGARSALAARALVGRTPAHGGLRAFACGLAVGLAAAPIHADTILGTKHDLSIAGPGNVRATSESEVCLFCHTPHRGTGETPLWNHTLSMATYTPYSSSTTRATIGQPTGASKLCLSCHDGTVAIGMVRSRPTAIPMRNSITTMPTGPSNLGTDLSDDHPISFVYNSALASANGELNDPSVLIHAAKLDSTSQLQCTSCHNPHDNQFGKFLVRDNYASGLCVECHKPNYWQDSSHRLSPKTWNGSGINPWPHTTNTTVAANACENCHAPHSAGTPARLLNFADEEQNCFSCHNGSVAQKKIQPEFNKISTHPIFATSRVHDPMEDPINPPRHVECVDCHNPHASTATTARAPNASGALAGVKGVNDNGAVMPAVATEYQLCFRCHGDSVNRGRAWVNRQFPVTNTRIQFQVPNASYHPVEAAGRNGSVPSLVPPLTVGSRIYCTDCHNNDQGPATGGAGPNGPHGSVYPPILERQLQLLDNNPENSGTYDLCYKCHSRASILANDSFPYHNSHVVTDQAACTTCHDPHGVQTQPHLINFNVNYVTASSNGRLEFVSTGIVSGNCSLTCHGHDHNASPYGFAARALPKRKK